MFKKCVICNFCVFDEIWCWFLTDMKLLFTRLRHWIPHPIHVVTKYRQPAVPCISLYMRSVEKIKKRSHILKTKSKIFLSHSAWQCAWETQGTLYTVVQVPALNLGLRCCVVFLGLTQHSNRLCRLLHLSMTYRPLAVSWRYVARLEKCVQVSKGDNQILICVIQIICTPLLLVLHARHFVWTCVPKSTHTRTWKLWTNLPTKYTTSWILINSKTTANTKY